MIPTLYYLFTWHYFLIIVELRWQHNVLPTYLGMHSAGQVTSQLASVANRFKIGMAGFNPLGNAGNLVLPTALDSIAGSTES